MHSQWKSTVVKRLLSGVFAFLMIVSLSLGPILTEASVASAQDAQEIEPQAAPGDLDPSFGSGGKVTTDFFGSQDIGEEVLLQPDGKIVVVGFVFGGILSDFALARYNADGSLDSRFGAGGKATTDFFNNFDGASAGALQQDGKILAAGESLVAGDAKVFTIARYNTTGTLDLGFGAGGKAIVDFGTLRGFGGLRAIAIQSDGKIVLAGRTGDFSSFRIALARLNPGGTLDTTFGNGGKVWRYRWAARLAALGTY